MKLDYNVKIAIVDNNTGKAWVENTQLTLERPFQNYIELVSAFFSKWDGHPEKFEGRYSLGVISSELVI